MSASLRRVGRLLLSAIFVQGGLNAFREPGPRSQQAATLGIPEPALAVRAKGLTMVVAGAALAAGVAPRAAAGALVASLVPTTLAGHRFWDQEDARGRAMQLTQFLKNLGLIGGLLCTMADDG